MYGFDFSSIKSVALREPLVDTVDYKAVLTDACAIMVKYSMKNNNILSIHREIARRIFTIQFKKNFSLISNLLNFVRTLTSTLYKNRIYLSLYHLS